MTELAKAIILMGCAIGSGIAMISGFRPAKCISKTRKFTANSQLPLGGQSRPPLRSFRALPERS